jgi:hypothetical protein
VRETDIERSVGITRKGDQSHVDSLLAAGGGFGPRAARPAQAAADEYTAPARAVGVKGQGVTPGAAAPVNVMTPPRQAHAAPSLNEGGSGALKPVKPLKEHAGQRKLTRSPIPPTPKVAWLRLEQLRIDDAYQREVSEQSLRLIRRMVEHWDWARFKPLSVAEVGAGLYEVVDGQHSAIAAATHGSIEALPCLVLQLASQAQRAAAFVGVNSERTALKSYALFRGRLVAGEPLARVVSEAVEAAGARLVEVVSAQLTYKPGDVACIATLLQIAKLHGRTGLERVLRICVAAEVGPIPSALLKALDVLCAAEPPEADGGGARRRAAGRHPPGRRHPPPGPRRGVRRPGPEHPRRPRPGAEHRAGAV